MAWFGAHFFRVLFCAFLCGLIPAISAIAKSELFPYGQVQQVVNGDEVDQFITNGGAEPFTLTHPVVLYGKKYSTVHVSYF